MTDEQIDNLILKAKVMASDDFSERLSNAIEKTSAKEKQTDALCETLLINSKISASPTFTKRVFAKISNQKKNLLNRGIFALMSVSTIAACLAIAVISMPQKPTFSVSEADFQEMSDINNEIYALQTLIVEGEFIDELKL